MDYLFLTKRKEESLSMKSADLTKDDSLPRQQLNTIKFNEENVYFMDISSNKKWLCYVSQLECTPAGKITNSLNVCKFTAFNDKDLKEEEVISPSDNNEADSLDSKVQMEEDPEPNIMGIRIDTYFDPLSQNTYFLSISFDGRYITLSSFPENGNSTDGNCFVFMVQNDKISLHCEIKRSGRAVFLNRGSELCLAIVNTDTLRIYNSIRNFSKNMPYDEYDLTPFMSSDQPRISWITQFQLTGLAYKGAVPGSSHCYPKHSNDNLKRILAVSAYIKENILLKLSPRRSGKIEFWSLKLDMVQLTSISASFDPVIAISDDLKYAATTSRMYIYRANDPRTRTSPRIVNICNLENGCIIYKLKCEIPTICFTHATFCRNSRYLALSGLITSSKKVPRNKSSQIKIEAIFQVWHIENQVMIYSVTKKMKQHVKRPSSFDETIMWMKPFVFEERAAGDKVALKGFYSYLDQVSDRVILKCFPINFNNYHQSSNTIQWLIEDELHLHKDIDPYGIDISTYQRRFNMPMEEGKPFLIQTLCYTED